MGTVKRTEIGAVRDIDHVEKLTADDSVVVQCVVSLLGDPKVRFRETAGGWNEDGESLPSLDPFGGNGSCSSYVAYAPPPSCSGWWAKSSRPERGTENSMIGTSPGPRRNRQWEDASWRDRRWELFRDEERS